MDFNNNFFNPNMNPYFTPTSFDSDNCDPTMYNMNQSYMLNWDYSTQYVPQSQYFVQDWNNHHHSSQSQYRYNSPESYNQPPYQHPASYTPSPEEHLEESIDRKKRMEVLKEFEQQIQILEDSKSRQNFQIKYSYSIFQEEHTDFKKSMEFMIQFQSDPLDMIQVRLN